MENLQYNFQVIGITETGIREDYPHVPVDIPNYSFYQTKTTTSKGGSALYVLNSLACAERKDLNTQIHGELETTFVEIEKKQKKECYLWKHSQAS